MKKFILVIPSSLILFGCSTSSGVENDSTATNRSAVYDDGKTQALSMVVTDKTLRTRPSAKVHVSNAEPLDNVAHDNADNPPENRQIEHESQEHSSDRQEQENLNPANPESVLGDLEDATRRVHGGRDSEIVQVQEIDSVDSNGLPWLGIHGFINGQNQNCYFKL